MFGNYKFLRFFKEVGGVKGRKKIHKMIYLLQQMGYEFNCEYAYCHYGPYSSQLQMILDRMSINEMLNECVINNNCYEYSITDYGTQLCAMLEREEIVNEFKVPLKTIELLNKKDASLLELASTIVFVRNASYSLEEEYNKIKELKPRLIDRYDEAKIFLEELDL